MAENQSPGTPDLPESEAPDQGRPNYLRDTAEMLDTIKEYFGINDDFLAALLANQVQTAHLEDKQSDHLERIAELNDRVTAEMGCGAIGKFPTEMSHNVPSDTSRANPVETVRTPSAENHTRVTAVSLGWPDGTNNLVGIKLRTGNGLTLLPRNPEDEFLAFNDFTDTFEMRFVLLPDEELVAETVNLDGSNDHFVNIVAHIEELSEYHGDERDSSEGGEN